MPRTPETHAKMPAIHDAWNALEVDRMVDDAIAGITWIDYRCPAYRPPRKWPRAEEQATRDSRAEQ
jgi:thiamine biosynthesis protein ThiI